MNRPEDSATWYLCQRRDDVAHHNSWICHQVTDFRDAAPGGETPTMLVAIPWYVPRVAHTAAIRQQLSRTGVRIIAPTK